MLREYFTAFDTLFPSARKTAELESLLATETQIFTDLFTNVPTHRALIPRTRDWIETGISADLVNGLAELNRPVEPAL